MHLCYACYYLLSTQNYIFLLNFQVFSSYTLPPFSVKFQWKKYRNALPALCLPLRTLYSGATLTLMDGVNTHVVSLQDLTINMLYFLSLCWINQMSAIIG